MIREAFDVARGVSDNHDLIALLLNDAVCFAAIYAPTPRRKSFKVCKVKK